MNKLLHTTIGAVLLAWGSAAAAAEIDVMTQNQYIGADIGPLITTAGTPAFNDAVVAILQQIAANRAPERLKKLALEIRLRNPHLVGLQEVWKLECVPVPDLPLPPGVGCDDPSIRGAFNDHLTGTTAALKALGADYAVVAKVTDLNLQSFGPYPGIPFYINGVPAFVRVTDRDVILARRDVARSAKPVDFGCDADLVSDDGCNFQFVVDLPPIGRIERGFVAVDVTVNGKPYRFVNAHLETRDPPLPAIVQAVQMQELLTRMLSGTPAQRKLILVGDFNSDPNEPADPYPTPYMQAYGAGLYDTWLLRPFETPGYTCCQAEDLRNLPSSLSQRIDHVFTREMPWRVEQSWVLGNTILWRLTPQGLGLWPSDHGAVVTGLRYR